MSATFDPESFTYSIDGAEVDALTAKGASAGVAREAKANISLYATQLQSAVALNGGIARSAREIDQFEAAMMREVKLLHMAEFAFANGGIEQVKNWSRAEEIIFEQWNGNTDFPGLQAFAQDVRNGRYGTKQLRSEVLARGVAYSSAGRLTYENERLAARMAQAEMEARRVMGGVETHCGDCPRWAAMGWIEAARMYAEFALGMAQCKYNDYCTIITRRAAVDARQAVGKNAVLALMQGVARTAKGAGVLVAALALFRYASNNPRAIEFALGLLMKAIQGEKVRV